jgi:hypothetical protein
MASKFIASGSWLLPCRRIVFFDSLGGRNPWAIDSIKSWLADEAKVRGQAVYPMLPASLGVALGYMLRVGTGKARRKPNMRTSQWL